MSENIEYNLNENAGDVIEELKLRLGEAKQMEESLWAIENMSPDEKAQVESEFKSSKEETLEAMEAVALEIKSLFDKAITMVEGEHPDMRENLEEITTRFLRSKDASEMLEVINMLEEKLLPPLEKAA